MRKVLRGYAKDRNGNLILIGTIAVPHSKDKPSPRERHEKAHLVSRAQRSSKKIVSRLSRSIGALPAEQVRRYVLPNLHLAGKDDKQQS
jgi:hypothetical protein